METVVRGTLVLTFKSCEDECQSKASALPDFGYAETECCQTNLCNVLRPKTVSTTALLANLKSTRTKGTTSDLTPANNCNKKPGCFCWLCQCLVICLLFYKFFSELK